MQLKLNSIDLKTSFIKPGSNSFIYFDEVESTLDIALRSDIQKNSVGKIIITDNQKKGRGSYNKIWFSEPNKDLTFSIVLGNTINFSENLVENTCDCIVEILNEYNIVSKKKLPNDVFVGEKKIAGILLSKIFKNSNLAKQVLSIGFNINSRFDIKEKNKNYTFSNTSLIKELKKEVKREEILEKILEKIDKIIRKQEGL